MIPIAWKKQIETLVAGKSHVEREGAALALAEAASGEAVQFLRCSRGTLTGWIDPEAKRLALAADAKPLDTLPAWTKHITATVSEMTAFQRLLAQGLIPPAEIEAARNGGLRGWRQLRAKYGVENPPTEDRRFGGGAA